MITFRDARWQLVMSFDRCLKETEEMFAPAVTAMYIEAQGVDKSSDVVQQVKTVWQP